MRRVSAEQTDVFRPVGQVAEELRLANDETQAVIEVLEPHLSDDRIRRISEVISHRTRDVSVAIEGVHDPHNTAAVIRTADAFGLQTVHVVERGIRFVSSRKITQGAHKWVDLGVWGDVSEFSEVVRKEGKKIFVAAADGDLTADDLVSQGPLTVVFGNEAVGISEEMHRVADGVFKIPMYGFVDSFNISVAAAITLSRLRSKGGGTLSDEDQNILKARFYLRAVRQGQGIVKKVLGEQEFRTGSK